MKTSPNAAAVRTARVRATSRRPQAGTPGSHRWEDRLLAIMAYPMNLAAAGFAALLLSIPLVTAVPAAIAAARAMNGWLADGDSSVFTATFRQFAATWRRSLPAGIIGFAVTLVLVVDAAFLADRVAHGAGGVALVMAAATVPVAVSLALLALALPVAATRQPDGSLREWLAGAGYLVAGRPLRSLILLAIVVASGLTFYLLPAFAPFFALSVPGYLALTTFGHGTGTTGATGSSAMAAAQRPPQHQPTPLSRPKDDR